MTIYKTNHNDYTGVPRVCDKCGRMFIYESYTIIYENNIPILYCNNCLHNKLNKNKVTLMIDEEKAEEYVKNVRTEWENQTYWVDCTDEVKQAYLDGLAEGRKELEQWKQEWQDVQIKANEEGFARTTLQIKHSELEKENKELKEQIENLKMVTSSWIMSLMDIKESKVNDRRGGVLREIERRMEKLAK